MSTEILSLINELNTGFYGNPSSLHSLGRKSRKALTEARSSISKILNADTEEIIFTSGATEANNFIFAKLDYDLIITSPAEHASVIEAAKASGKAIIWLDLDQQGFIDIEELTRHLEVNYERKILLSLMHANNEIGTLQDLDAISQLKQKHPNLIWHSDCVQSFSKYPIDVKELNIDLISASAHKIHGPKGCGLLYIRKQLKPSTGLITGGGQEFGLRSGTENLIGILAMTEAAKSLANKIDKLKTLHNYMQQELAKIDGLIINGPPGRLLGNFNICLTHCRLKSEELVLQMDLAGVCISSGSACSSNKAAAEITSSYVLRACKIKEDIASKSVRVSLSILNNETEIDEFIKITKEIQSRFPVFVTEANKMG